MTPQMRRKIVRQLEAVQKAYKLEKQHWRYGQAIITDFFKTTKTNTSVTDNYVSSLQLLTSQGAAFGHSTHFRWRNRQRSAAI